jgi:hypothetical protein
MVDIHVPVANYSLHCGVGRLGIAFTGIHARGTLADDLQVLGLIPLGDTKVENSERPIYRHLPPGNPPTDHVNDLGSPKHSRLLVSGSVSGKRREIAETATRDLSERVTALPVKTTDHLHGVEVISFTSCAIRTIEHLVGRVLSFRFRQYR